MFDNVTSKDVVFSPVTPRFAEAREVNLRLVQLDLGDRAAACEGLLDYLAKIAKHHNVTLSELMESGAQWFCHCRLSPVTLANFQHAVEERWGQTNSNQGWEDTFDLFEQQLRAAPVSAEHASAALTYLAALASLSDVTLARSKKDSRTESASDSRRTRRARARSMFMPRARQCSGFFSRRQQGPIGVY
mmetsp:Transcript_34607/g.80938  ORF Transcript_34607/g.80938 Transcript_34607/m.80938 type:complete len:189 (-) Transcript_34607:881-1447(-)